MSGHCTFAQATNVIVLASNDWILALKMLKLLEVMVLK